VWCWRYRFNCISLVIVQGSKLSLLHNVCFRFEVIWSQLIFLRSNLESINWLMILSDFAFEYTFVNGGVKEMAALSGDISPSFGAESI
jgi:hypothetical protein